ncbi:MAG TPA: TetR/AcrR family transcriptional regulator [Spirochaetota bacterium]|nr:TetR/AcrR family transcriptional regulator [Spirochaetota bacterium]HPF07270.1 TetR/AcrR family transcriptional regulator [Spirochaetota bacterium]HPJ44012.1 TetR/AcrR family transcriptional regulator [Spirochaetota bacterium]HPR39036.1 TetR/AcrR family transcriptional regulator [Spirochaetota bacterium]
MPPKGEKRKQQIIDTAKNMFINKGFQSTHIGQVCEHLDIARGTVYQYFSNKKEILYAILDTVAENIEDILDPDDLGDFLERKPEMDTIVKFVDDRIASCLSVLSNEPIVIRLIYRDIVGIDEEVSEKVSTFLIKVIEIISKEIEILRDNSIFKKDVEPHIAASMLLGAIMMIVYQYSKSNKDYLDKSVTKAMAITYLHGVYETL